ncbi:MAG: CRISPR/Cas system-associated exonuclease Cas4 (RecB family) [Kiritimatiellia bacterium]|jgi:CRISPR/Cas system-associated exonuclease Cas4 (RecB family)
MAELINDFSWSHSAASDFKDCHRKRYLEKYAKWGGWSREATEEQRTAYRLSKMDNRYSLQGEVVERAAMWMLRQKQKGVTVSADEAYETIARGLLRKAWDESTKQLWKVDVKKRCLHEHYYPDFLRMEQMELMVAISEAVKLCLHNFEHVFVARFADITADNEVQVARVGMGDPEHFMFEGVKVYAIPDFVHRQGARWFIHDWKSGKIREEHHKQLGVYALWAHIQHQVAPEDIHVSLEYLQVGQAIESDISEADLEATRVDIRSSVDEMKAFLVDGSIRKNEPLPREGWAQTPQRSLCKYCSFYELCAPEFDQ